MFSMSLEKLTIPSPEEISPRGGFIAHSVVVSQVPMSPFQNFINFSKADKILKNERKNEDSVRKFKEGTEIYKNGISKHRDYNQYYNTEIFEKDKYHVIFSCGTVVSIDRSCNLLPFVGFNNLTSEWSLPAHRFINTQDIKDVLCGNQHRLMTWKNSQKSNELKNKIAEHALYMIQCLGYPTAGFDVSDGNVKNLWKKGNNIISYSKLRLMEPVDIKVLLVFEEEQKNDKITILKQIVDVARDNYRYDYIFPTINDVLV